MNLYVASSCNTKTKEAAFAYKIHNAPIVSQKNVDMTAPKQLLRGIYNMFDSFVKGEGYKTQKELTLIVNSEFVIDAFNQNKIEEWKANGWKKQSGEPVAADNFWRGIDKYLSFFKEKGVSVFATKPVLQEEKSVFNSVSLAALEKRKH